MSNSKQKLRKQRLRKQRSKKRIAEQTPTAANVRNADHQVDIERALEMLQAGALDEAKAIYLRVLSDAPENPDAWHLLGMTLHAAHEHTAAIECLQNASHLVPNHPDILSNLGLVFRAAGNLIQACWHLEQASQAQPDSETIHNNLGTVYLELGKLEAAESQFETAISLNESFDNAAMNLGNVWQRMGKSRDAEQIYRQALLNQPKNVSVLTNLGEALRNQGKWEESVEVLEQVIKLAPNQVETRLNLGRSLINLRRLPEAEWHFNELISQHPDLPKPYHYLGKLKLEQRDFKHAESNIERALELDEKDMFALSSLGFACIETGQLKKAENCFREVVRTAPDMSDAHGSLLFLMSSSVQTTPRELFDETKKWAAKHGNLERLAPHENQRQTNRKLKIGYVSPDLRNHAVASFFKPVLQSHDSELYETYCYAEIASPDAITEQLISNSDHWFYTKGLSNRQVAEKILSDQIDILVDLAGHTANNRLIAFAHRPAPIQVTWIGYPNTTGLDSIDYRLTCDVQNPINEPTFHTEELIRMPFGSFCFSTPKNAPDVGSLPAERNGYVTFGSLHRPLKISETARDQWAEVLRSCPNSKMLIFNTRFNAESAEELLWALESRGISRDRIDIQNQYDGDSYLNIYKQIDIGLDVTPWAGATTTMEALWMGVPVIAYYGDRRSARSTAAILKNVGHEEWIAYSAEQYVELATNFSSDMHELGKLRKSLRHDTESTIVNATKFTRELERTYRAMWKEWCEKRQGTYAIV